MSFKPYDYQVSMVDHLVSNDHGALFVQMGLGKTACTLEALHRVGGKALILAPLRVANMVWSDQVKQWDYPLKVANLRTKEGMQAWEDGSADIYTVNFEMISRGILDKLIRKDMPVDTLIIDELSCLKANSKRTKTVIRSRKSFRRVWGLTGTPSPNGLMDLFYQLKVIDGGKRLGKFITHFRSRWFTSDYMGYNWEPKPHAHKEIHQAIADICHIKLSGEHMAIPECDMIDVDIKLSAGVYKQYKALEKDLVIQLGDDTVDAQSAATLVNKLQQMTAGTVYGDEKQPVKIHTAKHKPLAKILSKHEPVLILTKYRTEMEAVLEAFPEVQPFDEKRMDDWKAGRIPAWVANPASLSHGIDGIQQSCSTIVWLSLTYSLEQYEQTNARILRTGQKKASTIYRIMAEDTIDWVVASALEQKNEGQSTLMSSVAMLQRATTSGSRPDPSPSKPLGNTRGLSGIWHGL